jgi:DNA polymerase III epsilon subunit family exonuclease
VRVAIDLETTGLHPEQDAVIEIGALKFAGDEVIETFESFVAPGVAIPYRIQRLTGISLPQLKGAPTMAEVAPRLRAFLGEHPLVGHSVQFDAAFLRRAGLARRNPLVDTYELASALLPGLQSYTLAAVGEALGVRSPTYHRALADAQLSRDVFLALLERLDDLDPGTLDALSRLAAPQDWTPAYFVRAALRAQRSERAIGPAGTGTTLGDQLAAKLGLDPSALARAMNTGARSQRLARPHVLTPVATPEVVAPDMPQLDAVAAAVSETLTAGGALLVETLGDAASLSSCLIPALRWAQATGGRVLVSAADAEGASRIARQVLPRTFASAQIELTDVPVAEVYEHGAYLCLHRWYGAARVARDGLLARDVARGLAKLTVWAGQTQTGTRYEVALVGQEMEAWERSRSGPEFADTVGTCAYRRDGYCYVATAQAAAQDARVIVTTHAALASQLAGADAMLPEATRAIILDAHLLEEELRRVRSFTLDRQELLTLLATLATTEEPGGHRVGLLRLAAARADRAGGNREHSWFAQVERTRQSAEKFFAALKTVLTHNQGTANGGAGESTEGRTLRLDLGERQSGAWAEAAHSWHTLEERLGALAKQLREVAQLIVATLGKNATASRDGVATDLLALARRLEHICDQGASCFHVDAGENTVQWLRVPYTNAPGANEPRGRRAAPTARPGKHSRIEKDEKDEKDEKATATAASEASSRQENGRDEASEVPALHTAPVQVGALLQPLWSPERSLVLAGSSLAVAGDFTYTRAALGLPDAMRTLETSLDRAEQTLMCLPEDVPEPNAPQYQRHLDEALIRLAVALNGQLVAIFPSHAALRSSALGIRRSLERDDILVLAQGQDGSTRQLWQTFRAERRVVLLGAGAFWEGAGQLDQPPACVVVTRVPFPALSDPLLAARAELWADPQNQFVVPHAALKLRQALVSLCWSHHQRNTLVLFDRRLQTRSYGSMLIGSLARCTQYQAPMAHIAERVSEWVEQP